MHHNRILHQLHHLDDFLFLAPHNATNKCHPLSLALTTLEELRILVATHKTEGLSTCITFLGIIIDTQTFELQLPEYKLHRTQELLHSWLHKRSCCRNELAAAVTPQRRTFLTAFLPYCLSYISLTTTQSLHGGQSQPHMMEHVPARLEW